MLKRALVIVALALLAPATGGGTAHAAPCKQGAAAVEDAFRITLDAIKEDRTAPPRAARTLAALAVAMDDALEATAKANRCTTAPTAARAAAAPVIAKLLWATEAAEQERERARRLSARDGAARGARAARRTLARIASDRLNPDETTTVPVGRELWQPAYPDFMGPTDVSAATWRPWNVTDVKRIRPPRPPTGKALEEQTREVWRIGQQLTPEQRAAAVFWADGAGTVTPPGHWTQIALDTLPDDSGGRLADQMAIVETAQADGFIACWDAKYAYWLARPITLIQRFDPAWRTALPTPPFPAYVSGHATTSAAAAAVLGALVPKKRTELWAQAQQASLSRIWAGIHFPVDGTEGLRLGKRVAAAALRRRAGT